jgi:membrane protease YdiL (CAAX protease family)
VVFGIAHAYQGVKPTITIAVYGVLYGVLVHYRGSLVPGMLTHACADMMTITPPVQEFLWRL